MEFSPVGAWGEDKLANQGERLKLSYGAGLGIIEFEYDDRAALARG